MKAWKYSVAYLIPVTAVTGALAGGIFTFLTPFTVFVLVPLLDILVGTDSTNPTTDELTRLQNRLSFRLVLYLFVPVQFGLVVFGAVLFTTGTLTLLERAGLVLSVGIVTGGLGITIAHELAHKKRQLDICLGKALLMSVCYMHFEIEHNLGHHVRVATPEDPATARFGESFYAFCPRTIRDSFKSAWRIEVSRLAHQGESLWSPRNHMIWNVALPVALATGFAVGLGWLAALFFFLQSLVAFSLLEAVNYIEHYGLNRKQLAPGRYEKVTPAHSWDANQRLTNYLLFKLQRHADHHVHPVRAYQTLRHLEDSPKLPTGYAGTLVLALVPPLWRRVMHPRLLRTDAGSQPRQQTRH